MRLAYLAVALAVALVAAVAVAVAARTDPDRLAAPVDPEDLPVGPQAPELDATGWLNTGPLTNRDLAGKVVLYDFWTYSCVNCVRTMPYLRAWYDRYEADGLVIVGVHTPEFEFEKDPDNVAAAARELGARWPVALDARGDTWDAFQVRFWPTKFVYDREGRLRWSHIGEGQYTATESVLRSLLGVDPASPRAVVPGEVTSRREQRVEDDITRETYLGTRRGVVAEPGAREYPPADVLALGDAALEGAWRGDAERVVSVAAGASIVLAYRSAEVNLVMSSEAGGRLPVDAYVELDGEPIPPELRSDAVQVDGQGRTFVRVDAPDLYPLLRSRGIEQRVLRVTASAPGLAAYAFTFGV